MRNNILSLLCACACFAQTDWTWRNPLPQGNRLLSAVYGNGRFVAVGNKGTVLTSPDGIAWTNQPAVTSRILYSITSGEDAYVAVGQEGTIITSMDGAAWIVRNSGTTRHL